MPDIWTHHPEIVRDLLREAGFTCGVEPRILKGRDPDWTCIVDGQRIGGDIYIHQAGTTLSAGMAALVFGLLGVLGLSCRQPLQSRCQTETSGISTMERPSSR